MKLPHAILLATLSLLALPAGQATYIPVGKDLPAEVDRSSVAPRTDTPMLVAAGTVGVVELRWTAPSREGFEAPYRLEGYRVYRSIAPETEKVRIWEDTAQASGWNADIEAWADPDCPLMDECRYWVTAYAILCGSFWDFSWDACEEREGSLSNEAVAIGPARSIGDADGDTILDAVEVLNKSDPFDEDSTIDSDDDCDGTPNWMEPTRYDAMGGATVAIDDGQTFDPITWSGTLQPPTARVTLGGC